MALVADRMPAADVHLVNDGLRLAILAQDGEPAGEHPAVTPELAAPALVVRGADRRNGALGVEGAVAPGSVVQFQVRDPRSASEAFERALAAAAPGGGAGALLFRSEARPAAWFGGLPSDATTVTDTLPTAALAGCATRTQVGPGAPGYHPIRDWATLLLVDDVQAG
jgi:small ligand-binding sensory domain FIST